ncbi:MAG: TAT-variant-translocated molybdopterin oxidoreductase [Planctomycetales bacterium]
MHAETNDPREPHRGRRYWRSLDEFADAPEFRAALEREFPVAAALWPDGPSRRQFLKLMGASFALAGIGTLAGCGRQPEEKIVPYVRQPERIVPGQPLFYATAMTLGGYATGLLVESHMGRPIKVEGNLEHPASLGATDAFAQAAVLDLYDPDRSQTVNRFGHIDTWDAFLTSLKRRLDAARATRGRGLRILTETITSPTLFRQIRQLLAEFPEAGWHEYEPVNRDNAIAGAEAAFGEPADLIHRFDRADVVLAIDSDFLCSGPGHVRYAKDFSRRRRIDGRSPEEVAMNRLYAVESAPTPTGSKADHRWALRPAEIVAFTRALAKKVGVQAVGGEGNDSQAPLEGRILDAIAEDLRAHSGRSIVIAGDAQPPEVHALALAMNAALGNLGETVLAIEPVAARVAGEGGQVASLRRLVEDMRQNAVETLVILGGNPVVTAPADFGFSNALERAAYKVHLGLYEDETSIACDWHVPETHFLEAWSDARAYDGTASIVQPLIAPLYDGRSAHELLAAMLGRRDLTPYDLVRETWRENLFGDGRETASDDEAPAERREADFERYWQQAVHDGVVPDTQSPPKTVSISDAALARIIESAGAAARTAQPNAGGFAVLFRPDPTIHDGRFANNGWLQELPKPLTKLTWDNPALISKRTADALGIANGNLIDVTIGERSLRLPVWIVPGMPDDTVALHFGYGRSRAGRVGNGAGFDVYPLRTSAAMDSAAGASVRAAGGSYRLACTQEHHLLEGRDLVRSGTFAEWSEHPEQPGFMADARHALPKTSGRATQEPPPISMYPEYEYEGHKWGMSIDMTACVGCGGCVVACQAENNIPVVGKEQVAVGREMHWLRIDTYYEGHPEAPDSLRTYHQPLPCMHCEKAPCEPVCPVAATTHSDEGLNEMTYNRCVGTRYCSNNCPYKVRRFNYLDFNADAEAHPSLRLVKNPEVTVRSRGVMEKCTYCVQRIGAGRIAAEKEGRRIRDGEVVTACQQACPTEAIVFGDLNDVQSRVVRRTASPLDFALLGELNTRPRTTYVAALWNPNPRLEATTTLSSL